MLKFDTTSNEDFHLSRIFDRAQTLHMEVHYQELVTFLAKIHCNGTPLCFKSLLESSDDDFKSDLYNLQSHFDPSNGKLMKHYKPNCDAQF